MQDEAYQAEYDKAAAALEAAANGEPVAITAPGAVVTPEPEKVEAAPSDPETKPAEPEVDPIAEMRARLEKTEKALKDTQAWGTKNAQLLKEIERERQRQERETAKPAILDANPELADAIRYVASDPAPQQQANDRQQQWLEAVDKAHPGIFNLPDEDELVKAVLARRQAMADEWDDPLVAIREITAEKLAHTERQIGKRYMAEAAKTAQKSAMSVPGAGASVVATAPVDPQKEMADRYLNMSSADFEKERKRVLGH